MSIFIHHIHSFYLNELITLADEFGVVCRRRGRYYEFLAKSLPPHCKFILTHFNTEGLLAGLYYTH